MINTSLQNRWLWVAVSAVSLLAVLSFFSISAFSMTNLPSSLESHAVTSKILPSPASCLSNLAQPCNLKIDGFMVSNVGSFPFRGDIVLDYPTARPNPELPGGFCLDVYGSIRSNVNFVGGFVLDYQGEWCDSELRPQGNYHSFDGSYKISRSWGRLHRFRPAGAMVGGDYGTDAPWLQTF